MSKASDPNSVTAETLARLDKESGQSVRAVGNLLLMIKTDLPALLKEKQKDRDAAVARVKELNVEIVEIQTHMQLHNGESAPAA